MSEKVVKFLRQKDFILMRELGSGACGKTVILRDPIIEECFVCKKFNPAPGISEEYKIDLYENFKREIKLLYLINHPHIVRVFNYYLYPEQREGYILMEQVEGSNIEEYIKSNVNSVNDIFAQVVDGFAYLEKQEILHRDIRPYNILVSNTGLAKIIDFGFGKKTLTSKDYVKSITLNWWCETPDEFAYDKYDYSTEVYFIGKLFEKIISETSIEHFQYKTLLEKMCVRDPISRINSFDLVRKEMLSCVEDETLFTQQEKLIYRNFAYELSNSIASICISSFFHDEATLIEKRLEESLRNTMLEEYVSNNSKLIRCFVNGEFYSENNAYISVENLEGFVSLLKKSPLYKKNIIINNILTRLDNIMRYESQTEAVFDESDIPF